MIPLVPFWSQLPLRETLYHYSSRSKTSWEGGYQRVRIRPWNKSHVFRVRVAVKIGICDCFPRPPRNLSSSIHRQILTTNTPTWVKESQLVSTPLANYESTVVKTDGQTTIIANVHWEQLGNRLRWRELLTARVLCWRKLALKQNSLILLFASVSEYNLSRMVKSMIPLVYCVVSIVMLESDVAVSNVMLICV